MTQARLEVQNAQSPLVREWTDEDRVVIDRVGKSQPDLFKVDVRLGQTTKLTRTRRHGRHAASPDVVAKQNRIVLEPHRAAVGSRVVESLRLAPNEESPEEALPREEAEPVPRRREEGARRILGPRDCLDLIAVERAHDRFRRRPSDSPT